MGQPLAPPGSVAEQVMQAGIPVAPEIITRPGQISFRSDRLAPPSQVYVTVDDALILTIWNSLAGQTVTLNLRILTPQQGITPQTFTFPVPATRLGIAFTIAVPEGFILSASVSIPGAGVQRGQTFVQLALVRSGTSTLGTFMILLQNYVSSGNSTTFPFATLRPAHSENGWIQQVPVTTPAAGQQFTVVVPLGAMWRIKSVVFTFNTSTTTANRNAGIVLVSSAGIVEQYYISSFTQAASLVAIYTFTAGGAYKESAATAGFVNTGLGDATLLTGDRIASQVVNLQATDQISTISLVVEEWIQP